MPPTPSTSSGSVYNLDTMPPTPGTARGSVMSLSTAPPGPALATRTSPEALDDPAYKALLAQVERLPQSDSFPDVLDEVAAWVNGRLRDAEGTPRWEQALQHLYLALTSTAFQLDVSTEHGQEGDPIPRPVLPYMSLLPRLDAGPREAIKTELIKHTLLHLRKPREEDGNYAEVIQQADVLATLVPLKYLRAAGVLKVALQLLGKRSTRFAGVLLACKLMDVSLELLLQCEEDSLNALRQAVASLPREVYDFDIVYMNETMKWADPASASSGDDDFREDDWKQRLAGQAPLPDPEGQDGDLPYSRVPEEGVTQASGQPLPVDQREGDSYLQEGSARGQDGADGSTCVLGDSKAPHVSREEATRAIWYPEPAEPQEGEAEEGGGGKGGGYPQEAPALDEPDDAPFPRATPSTNRDYLGGNAVAASAAARDFSGSGLITGRGRAAVTSGRDAMVSGSMAGPTMTRDAMPRDPAGSHSMASDAVGKHPMAASSMTTEPLASASKASEPSTRASTASKAAVRDSPLPRGSLAAAPAAASRNSHESAAQEMVRSDPGTSVVSSDQRGGQGEAAAPRWLRCDSLQAQRMFSFGSATGKNKDVPGHRDMITALFVDDALDVVVSASKDGRVVSWSAAPPEAAEGGSPPVGERPFLGVVEIGAYAACSMDGHPGKGLLIAGIQKDLYSEDYLPPALILMRPRSNGGGGGYVEAARLARPDARGIYCVGLSKLAGSSEFVIGETVAVAGGSSATPRSASPSAGGRVGVEDVIRVYDAEASLIFPQLVPKNTLRGHMGAITCVCMSRTADEPTVFLSGSVDGTVRLWDTRKGGCFGVLGNVRRGAGESSVRPSHSAAVTCMDINADCVLTGGMDRMVKQWDTRMLSDQSDRLLYAVTMNSNILKVALAPTKPHSATVAAVSTHNGLYVNNFLGEQSTGGIKAYAGLWCDAPAKKFLDVKWSQERDVVYAAGEDKRVEVYRPEYTQP